MKNISVPVQYYFSFRNCIDLSTTRMPNWECLFMYMNMIVIHVCSGPAIEGCGDKDNWRVVLGEHVQGREEGTEQYLKMEKIVSHPTYLREWRLFNLTR